MTRLKRLWAAALLACLLLCCCAAHAEEALFYTVTYHSNYGSDYEYTKTAGKEPGAAHEIIRSAWGKIGRNFAGWATSPDAAEADYLPGEMYTADENIDLYSVWAQPVDLGELSAQDTVTIPEPVVANEQVYVQFTVAQSDYYRLKSLDKALQNATTFSSIEILAYDGTYWDTISTGQMFRDPDTWQATDFSVSGHLEAGETYLLGFHCPPDPVKLKIENGISFITYHSNYGSGSSDYTKTVDKNPGEAAEIEKRIWGKVGKNFAGWAKSPDAAEADYLPGEMYTAEENIDLYSVWAEPVDLGEIAESTTVTIPEFAIPNQRIYVQFTAAQSDYYRLRTLDESLKNGTSYSTCELYVLDGSYWETISTGESITDEETWRVVDVTVSGQLEAGKTYLLGFHCPPDPVKLRIENGISFITYHSNYGSGSSDYTKTVDKNPGEAVVIEDSLWGKVGKYFAGWATTPDGTEADYLPGDAYTLDENIDLYSVWAQPVELGEFTGLETCMIPEFPVANERAYVQFTVSESGFYRLQSVEESMRNATTFSSIEILCLDGGYWDTVSSGEYIEDEETYRTIDFTVTAELEAGETYLLGFYCPPDPVKLLCEPQYPPEPYTAKVTLPAALTVIGEEMFAGASLESVYVPAAVERIEAHAFDACEQLTKVVIASQDVEIDENAFSGCQALLIVAPEESTAYDFAQAQGYEFRRLEE